MPLLINLCYIVASVLFILGIKMLGSARTARRGNALSALGMLIAVAATLADQQILSWQWIAAGLAAGALIGGVAAKRIAMTSMPELVGLFNGFGGAASLLVGWTEFEKIRVNGPPVDPVAPLWFTQTATVLAIIIGGITFTGSLIAYCRLSGAMSSSPTLFSGQKLLNIVLALLAVSAAVVTVVAAPGPVQLGAFIALVALALILGALAVIPIGGGDMPVVIALLNSCSGLAASAAGFAILNNVLVVAGCLVGASGIILTVIMCKAMNRSLPNVLFGGFGAVSGAKGKAVEGEMKPISAEDTYFVLEAASQVVIVPGYGMAVAQAQHVVKELGDALEANGTEVRYVIHPVAGRMPGHMNVLLAEADVPYEQLCEMDAVNPTMPNVDVAIVIGANDVVNPAALDDPSCTIYGMPIIKVHEAGSVIALKRGQGPGFSGLPNHLFFRQNTRMLYGDAKQSVAQLVAEFKNSD